MRHFFQIIIPCCLLSLFVFSSSVFAGANVFLYHRFDEARYPSTNIMMDVFSQQLAYLKAENYQVLALSEIIRRIRAGEALPDKCTALTIDDAFNSFKEKGFPLIEQYQYPVTLFVNTDSVGKNDYLDWEELAELVERGVEIGNHSASHDYLIQKNGQESDSQWRDRISQDIQRAQQAYLDHLGLKPEAFAYPFGEYSAELVKLVKKAGFTVALSQQSGVIHAGSDMMALPRFPMGGPYATLKGFKQKLGMNELIVAEEIPFDPVLGEENPPVLKVKLPDQQADLRRMNCFVQGDNSCEVKALKDQPGWYEIRAESPLTGRRNKYTLTAPNKKGSGWNWYSHMWISEENAVRAEE